MKQRARKVLAPLVVLLAPSAAHAHLVSSGLGPFYDGALHLVLSPMDIVRLLILSLFAGAQSPDTARAVIVAAPIAWLIVGVFGLTLDASNVFAVANGAGLFLLGAMVALDYRPPAIVATAVAAAFAGLLGFQSGTELRAADANWVALVGNTAVVTTLLLLATSAVALAKAFAARVACRVLGSWSAATGLLSIGWAIAENH